MDVDTYYTKIDEEKRRKIMKSRYALIDRLVDRYCDRLEDSIINSIGTKDIVSVTIPRRFLDDVVFNVCFYNEIEAAGYVVDGVEYHDAGYISVDDNNYATIYDEAMAKVSIKCKDGDAN